jgi:hypothetical protein
MCQVNGICFSKYILPFVVIFGIIVLFLIVFITSVIVYKCKTRRAKKMKKIDDYMKKMIQNKMNGTPTGKGKGLEDLVQGNPHDDLSGNENDQTIINKGDHTPLKSEEDRERDHMEPHSATRFGRNASH